MYNNDNVDFSLLDIYNFLTSESCKLSSYAIREGFAYFTEYALRDLKDDRHKLVMLAYYIVNCDERDFALHFPRIVTDGEILNSKLFDIPLISFALVLKKKEMYDSLISLGAIPVEMKLEDIKKIDTIKNVFISQYNKYDDHKEYLKMFREYMLLDDRYEEVDEVVGVKYK